MAWIEYLPEDRIPERYRVDDADNILRIHGVQPAIMGRHLELYRDLMKRPGALTRAQREMIAVAVSSVNECHY